MKLHLVLLVCVFGGAVDAQFDVDRRLVEPGDSRPVRGIPLDGLWAQQNFVGKEWPLGSDELGYLGTHTIDRVRWDSEERLIEGVLGLSPRRILELGDGRFLLERDRDPNGERVFLSDELYFGGKVRCTLVAWRDGGLCSFQLDAKAGSRFTRWLEGRGLTVEEGVVSGGRDAILRALGSVPLEEYSVESRMRRPNEEEMGEVWSVFELERWAEKQQWVLGDVERNFGHMHTLPSLNLASRVLSEAANGRPAELAPLALDEHEYRNWWPKRYADLNARARRIQGQVEERRKERMEWLSGEIESVEYTRGKDASDWSIHPSPGQLVQFHVVVWDASGRVLDDTRAKGAPVDARIAGDMPEGLQWALRKTAFGDVQRVKIPARLAWGDRAGDVEVEVEPLRGLSDARDEPPLRLGIGGYTLDPLKAESTGSGLRYRVLTAGDEGGATPSAGAKLRVAMAAWTPWNEELVKGGERTLKLSDPELAPGVREALSSMHVGEHRVLFLPPHLAERGVERAGIAQCVSVELLAIDGVGAK